MSLLMMPPCMVRLVGRWWRLATLTPSDLADAFNAVYAQYVVPFTVNAAWARSHIAAMTLRLDPSPLWLNAPVDVLALRFSVPMRHVADVHDQVGFPDLLERGPKCGDQLRRQIGYEADRVGQDHLVETGQRADINGDCVHPAAAVAAHITEYEPVTSKTKPPDHAPRNEPS